MHVLMQTHKPTHTQKLLIQEVFILYGSRDRFKFFFFFLNSLVLC